MRSILILLFSLSGFLVYAEERKIPQVEIEVPVIDFPFNLSEGGYGFPSMRQSLALSTDFYQTAHAAILGYKDKGTFLGFMGVAVFDIFSSYVPLGEAWLHEEWHRAIMGNRGIGSYNDVYNFPFFADVIAVSHVDDQELVDLKREFPAEQVRLSAAGMESQVYQNLYVEQTHFFNDAQSFDDVLLFMNAFSVTGYLSLCSSNSADRTTDEQNTKDGTNVMKRDFTGLDCNAWVYDLFRPDEPYAARGVHPSGVGIDRYIKYSDLSDHEKRFLKRQVGLSFLNLADPMLWGFDRFKGSFFGKASSWNIRASHYLTSFGYTVDLNFFLRTDDDKTKLYFILHNGFNTAAYFKGLTVSWLDHQLSDKFSITNSATLWPQPKNQRVGEHNQELLASVGSELAYDLQERTKLFLGLQAKTGGWQAGEEDIEKSWDIYAGFKQTVF